MKLLFDQNLSSRLVDMLQGLFPGSTHVRTVGLGSADDRTVWEYAARHGLAIVSKDSDFQQRSMVFDHPPKVIWVRLGNCTTQDVANLLRREYSEIEAFLADDQAAFLALA